MCGFSKSSQVCDKNILLGLEASYSREIKIHVYGKRQTSHLRLHFLEINNTRSRMVQNNSYVYGKYESTYHLLERGNSKRQMRRNHDHVFTSDVCYKCES